MNYDPRDPQLLAWLSGLPAETEYVMRCALMTALPSFRRNGEFKRHTETLRARLNPNERRLAMLMRRADNRAVLILRHLAGELERDSAGRRVSVPRSHASRSAGK